MRVLYCIIWAVGLSLMAGKAYPHSWYDPACCSERDCAPIPQGTKVEYAAGGYNVTLPGGSPIFFSQDKVKPSQDGLWHICINPVSGTRYCIYVPAGV